MENSKNRKRNSRRIIIVAIIITTAIGGCVCSINIQKYNTNSNQSVEQRSNTKNDSINMDLNLLK